MAVAVDTTTDAANLAERIIAEGAIGMSAVAKLAGSYRGGRPTAPPTVTRWATRGIRLPDARVVKLEAVRLGNRLVSSRQAFVRFLAAQQPPSADAPDAGAVRGPVARRRASEAAACELEKLGC